MHDRKVKASSPVTRLAMCCKQEQTITNRWEWK